jgi:hypothetical protein
VSAPEVPIETAIGEAMASAVSAICRAGEELSGGELTAATRRVGAERIYRLHELQQSAPELDFASVVRRAGKQVLRARAARDGKRIIARTRYRRCPSQRATAAIKVVAGGGIHLV